MAIDRGTRKVMFVRTVETFSILGVLGGAAWGIYRALGQGPFDLLMNAVPVAIMGFLAGTLVGVILGAIAVVFATIFR